MIRFVRPVAPGIAALVMVLALLNRQAVAEPTAGPPEWNDGGGSVYSGHDVNHPFSNGAEPKPLPVDANATARDIHTARKTDTAIVPSAHVEMAAGSDASDRRLGPPSESAASDKINVVSNQAAGGHQKAFEFGVPTQSMYTVASALAIVVGAFLLFVWVLRRGSKGTSRSLLPSDAVSVIGRVPLAARQVAQLLRVGNKLVLVAMAPGGGAKPITEITDPVEVDRLLGICQQQERHSTTRAFEDVFQDLAREPAAPGFFGGEALPPSPVAAAYRSERGGRRA